MVCSLRLASYRAAARPREHGHLDNRLPPLRQVGANKSASWEIPSEKGEHCSNSPNRTCPKQPSDCAVSELKVHALRPPTDHEGNFGISPSDTRQTHGVISGLASIISAKARS